MREDSQGVFSRLVFKFRICFRPGGNGLCYMVGREGWEGCADCPGDAKKLWEAAALGRGERHDDMREDSQGVFG